ncbi:MAG: hypothetical protein WKF58_13720 [Ilumatobacteraceae bacterium]
MANFPVDVADFMRSMMELSKRLAPLVGLAESAGGMFGLRIPGFGMGRAAPPLPHHRPPSPNRRLTAPVGPLDRAQRDRRRHERRTRRSRRSRRRRRRPRRPSKASKASTKIEAQADDIAPLSP